MEEELKQLKGVSETLFVPLCAKYFESMRPDAIIRDNQVGKILKKLGYDCSKFSNMHSIQLGIAVRTEILDRETSRFLARNPKAAVVNLGAGLCTRLAHVDNQSVLWFELDLPEVHRLWKKVFVETKRHRFVSCSVMDFRWIAEVKRHTRNLPVLFIAEGLLMYFSEREVKLLLLKIRDEFRGAEMLLEAMSPLLASNTRCHPAVSKTSATFKWGIRTLREIESWAPGIGCLEEWYYLDHHRDRWGWMQLLRLIPGLQQQMKIGHLRFS